MLATVGSREALNSFSPSSSCLALVAHFLRVPVLSLARVTGSVHALTLMASFTSVQPGVSEEYWRERHSPHCCCDADLPLLDRLGQLQKLTMLWNDWYHAVTT